LPATGKLLHLAFPGETHDVRIDAGVDAGGEITPWYDPMIAKLIVRGPDRDTALARLRRALAETEIAGVTTNVAFLGRVAAGRAAHPPGWTQLQGARGTRRQPVARVLQRRLPAARAQGGAADAGGRRGGGLARRAHAREGDPGDGRGRRAREERAAAAHSRSDEDG